MTAESPNVFVLGGARSGKSAYAEELGRLHEGPLLYIATAQAGDAEMAERIALHRARRGGDWETHEEPLALPALIAREAASQRFILIDCITLWISNLMHEGRDIDASVSELCALLPKAPGTIVAVSNEVGLGIVPENALARRFRDAAGHANQQIAAVSDTVIFMVSGLPMTVKQNGAPS